MKKKKSDNGTQQLIGLKSFSRNGLLTSHGELVFYLVSPTNISVLSQVSVGLKIDRLMQFLTVQPDIDICCLDDCECFESNKEYLQERIDEERNSAVRKILDADRKFLDEIQLSMSTARQFMFVYRVKNVSDEQSFATLNRIEKEITEQGFEIRRAGKSDIKRFLSLYFGYKMVDEELPDTDGKKSARKWVIPD